MANTNAALKQKSASKLRVPVENNAFAKLMGASAAATAAESKKNIEFDWTTSSKLYFNAAHAMYADEPSAYYQFCNYHCMMDPSESKQSRQSSIFIYQLLKPFSFV